MKIDLVDVSIIYKTGNLKNVGIKDYIIDSIRGRLDSNEFLAVDKVTFSLAEGDLLGIIGGNGAGKSTLLKVLTGIMAPSSGTAHVEGRIAALLELASGFDADMTIKENVFLRGAILGYDEEFIKSKYDDIIGFANLEAFQNRPFKQLSSGMKSRLAFSIASIVNPEILILDEVLSVGDAAFRKKSEQKMLNIIKSGVTTIIVSHSLSQIRRICNKVLWLEKGKQILFGEAELICDLYDEFMNGNLTLEECKDYYNLNKNPVTLRVMNNLYQKHLHRLPNAEERKKWFLTHDITVAAVEGHILSSEEYIRKKDELNSKRIQMAKAISDVAVNEEMVYTMYNVLLDRPPENEEIVTKYVNNGVTLEKIKNSIWESVEFKRIVSRKLKLTSSEVSANFTEKTATTQDIYAAYRFLLKRNPDEKAIAHIINRKTTIGKLRNDIWASPEFAKNVRNSVGLPQNIKSVVDYSAMGKELSFVIDNNYINGTLSNLIDNKPLREISEVMKLLPSSGTILDLGSHIGVWSMIFASEGWSVVAVEPDPDNNECMKKALRLNNADAVLVEAAVSSGSGKAMLYCSGNGSYILSDTSEEQIETAEVRTIKIAELTSEPYCQNRQIDFIKMSIQGSEYDAMNGAEDFLKKMKYPPVYSEVSEFALSRYGHTAKGFFKLMDELGYVPHCVEDEGLRRFVWRSSYLSRPVRKFMFVHKSDDRMNNFCIGDFAAPDKEEALKITGDLLVSNNFETIAGTLMMISESEYLYDPDFEKLTADFRNDSKYEKYLNI